MNNSLILIFRKTLADFFPHNSHPDELNFLFVSLFLSKSNKLHLKSVQVQRFVALIDGSVAGCPAEGAHNAVHVV